MIDSPHPENHRSRQRIYGGRSYNDAGLRTFMLLLQVRFRLITCIKSYFASPLQHSAAVVSILLSWTLVPEREVNTR